MSSKVYDVTIIGGGIVGMATAMALANRANISLLVLEAEDHLAAHQTGHNSGVIHSGIYYKPGSLKAKNCVAGAAAMVEFCREHDIPHEICGKVVVATDESELAGLDELMRRGTANGVPGLTMIGTERLRELDEVAGVHLDDGLGRRRKHPAGHLGARVAVDRVLAGPVVQPPRCTNANARPPNAEAGPLIWRWT